MKSNKKRFLGILLSFVLMIGISATISQAVYAEEEQSVEVYTCYGGYGPDSPKPGPHDFFDNTHPFLIHGEYTTPMGMVLSHPNNYYAYIKVNDSVTELLTITKVECIGYGDFSKLTSSEGEISVDEYETGSEKSMATITGENGTSLDVRSLDLLAAEDATEPIEITDVKIYYVYKAYNLWVGGVQVTELNKGDVLADDPINKGKVSYNPDTHTLTLDGANITADTEKQHNFSAIHYGDAANDLIIDATKESTVTGASYDDTKEKTSYGISSESRVTVRGKLTAAGGKAGVSAGVFAPAFVVEDKAEAKVQGDSSGVFISDKGSSITVSGKLTAEGDDYGICFYPDNTGSGRVTSVTVNSGAELTATGGMMGIVTNSDNGYVEIKKGAKVRAVGGKNGFYNSAVVGIVKNAVPGLGWTNPEGTEGKTYFDIDTQGRELGDDIKCAEFPAPEASVAKAPSARSLKYTGSAQELVTAGEAKDGVMKYALGKDGTTPLEKGWSASIPKRTEAGTYYVWYMAEGDISHIDSEPECVVAAIESEPVRPKPTPKPTIKTSGTPLVRMIHNGDTGLTVTWSKIQGADGYDIYFAYCGETSKYAATVKGNKTFSWTKSGLKKGRCYKAYVKAYVMRNGKKTFVKCSPLVHAYASGGSNEYTSAKAVTVERASANLTVGKAFQIKPSIVKLNKNKYLMPKKFAPTFRYMSSNEKVATVSSGGKVTAKGKGTCYIYVYAHNGVSKQVKVTVQ